MSSRLNDRFVIVADVGPIGCRYSTILNDSRRQGNVLNDLPTMNILLIAKDPIQETPVRNKVIWSLGIAILLVGTITALFARRSLRRA